MNAALPWLVVFGSRSLRDRALVFHKLDTYTAQLGALVVVTGAAEGADAAAEEWAYTRWHTVIRFHADWDAHGLSAGPRRNEEMASAAAAHPAGCYAVAFWDGRSPGTRDMIERCRRHRIPLKIVRF